MQIQMMNKIVACLNVCIMQQFKVMQIFVSCGHVEIDKGMKRYYYNLVDEVVDAKQGIKYLIENQKIGMSACTKLFKKNILDGVFFCEG